jgi:uncharacterized membrane protein
MGPLQLQLQLHRCKWLFIFQLQNFTIPISRYAFYIPVDPLLHITVLDKYITSHFTEVARSFSLCVCVCVCVIICNFVQ